jgi:hypothetical protein
VTWADPETARKSKAANQKRLRNCMTGFAGYRGERARQARF